jgi:hypothetical protein
LKWWPYYYGHYLLEKSIDLKELFNQYDTDQVFDMIDALIVADSVYDDAHEGKVTKFRAHLNKEYGRIGIAIDDEYAANNGGTGALNDLEPNEDGSLPGLEGIPMMGGFTPNPE